MFIGLSTHQQNRLHFTTARSTKVVNMEEFDVPEEMASALFDESSQVLQTVEGEISAIEVVIRRRCHRSQTSKGNLSERSHTHPCELRKSLQKKKRAMLVR